MAAARPAATGCGCVGDLLGRVARAVLWDLDGTLVDSADYHWRAWRDTLLRQGTSITYEQFLDGFGQKNDRILRKWFGADLAADRIEQLGGDKEALYRQMSEAEGYPRCPGAERSAGPFVPRGIEAGDRLLGASRTST